MVKKGSSKSPKINTFTNSDSNVPLISKQPKQPKQPKQSKVLSTQIKNVSKQPKIVSKQPNSINKNSTDPTTLGLMFQNKVLNKVRRLYTVIQQNESSELVCFNDYPGVNLIYIKYKFRRWMLVNSTVNINIPQAHGCKRPDAVFILRGFMFIIEIKSQKTQGSISEKLQTALFKKLHFIEMYPDFKIEYIYILSSWCEVNSVAELKFLESNLIPVFFAHKEGWETQLMNFIMGKVATAPINPGV